MKFYLFALLFSVVFFTGCSKKKQPLIGTREVIISVDPQIKTDPALKHAPIKIPAAVTSNMWLPNVMNNSHFIINDVQNISIKSKISIGRGINRITRILSNPISDGKLIFTMDADGKVSAFDVLSNKLVWHTKSNVSNKKTFSGGITYNNGYIFVATADAQMLKLEAKSGKIVTQIKLEASVRSQPIVFNKFAYLLNINNQIEAVNHENGEIIWSHSGISENLSLLGGSMLLATENFVIVPYSSGVLYALHPANGQVLWSTIAENELGSNPFGSIDHIKSSLLLDNNKLYIISSKFLTQCLDPNSGETIWQINAGSINNAVISGDFMFFINTNSEIVCTNKNDGKIYWIKSLEQLSLNNKTIWTTPILVNNMLFTANSKGELLFISIKSKKLVKKLLVNESISVQPAIIKNSIFVVTDKGNLIKIA